MKRKWFYKLFGRRILIILLLVLQAGMIVYLLISGSRASHAFNMSLNIISLGVVLYIISTKDKGAYKTAWCVLILVFPVFGGLLYLMFNFQTPTKRLAKKVEKAQGKGCDLYPLPGDGYEAATEELPDYMTHIRYLQEFAHFPVYDNTMTRYLTPGEEKFKALLEELEKAEKYIFLEYFIVEEGIMWNSVLEILKRKVQEGVIVRVLYDDVGCFLTLPQDYPKQLEQYGIHCAVFNPFRPFLTVKQNNRDHRKIAVIDGKVAFTGGINLADEYINAVEKYGHWKDSSIMLEGKGAWSFTLMFLEMWEVCTNTQEDYAVYYPWKEEPCSVTARGFVQPYSDSPLDKDNVGEHVYMQIISHAKDYVYINTPYLIVDDSMVSALCLAVKSGVDVRIITPHKWDKWAIHMTTRSYYRELVKAGVKIYEYTKGFNHAKTFVCDDRIGTVGTTNMDFRSLYLHFECGTVLYDCDSLRDVKADFLNTLEICHQVTEEDCKTNIIMRLIQDVLRLFAPLM